MSKKGKIITRVVIISVSLSLALGLLAFVFFNGNTEAMIDERNNLVVTTTYFGSPNSLTVYNARLRDLCPDSDVRLHPTFTRGVRSTGFSNFSVASGTYSGGDITELYQIESYTFHANVRNSVMIVLIIRGEVEGEDRAIVFNGRTDEQTRELHKRLQQIARQA